MYNVHMDAQFFYSKDVQLVFKQTKISPKKLVLKKTCKYEFKKWRKFRNDLCIQI